METEGNSEKRSKLFMRLDNENATLIPNLPHEIGILCLAKVPLWYRLKISCVCRGWRDVFREDIFWDLRREFSSSETVLLLWAAYPYKRDIWYSFFPSTGTWLKLPVMPDDGSTRCKESSTFAVVREKLFVIGGDFEYSWEGVLRSRASSAVFCFDMKLYQWKRIADLNEARANRMVAGVMDNQLYVFTEQTPESTPPHEYITGTIEVYFPISNKWRMESSSMKSPTSFLEHLAIRGKFIILYWEQSFGGSVILGGNICDSESTKRFDVPTGLNVGWNGRYAVEFNGKICIKKESCDNDGKRETTIMMYQAVDDRWEVIHGRQPLEEAAHVDDEGDQLVNLGGNLCTIKKFREPPGLRFEIKDLKKRVIASKSFMPTSMEEIQDHYIPGYIPPPSSQGSPPISEEQRKEQHEEQCNLDDRLLECQVMTI